MSDPHISPAMAPPADADVAVVGLGYVGLTVGTVFANAGLRVIALETNVAVRTSVEQRRSPFLEPGVDEQLRALPPGRLEVLDRLPDRLPPVVVVCVGTPVEPATKRPDLSHVEAAIDEVAARITDDTLVVVRSTVPVGTCRDVVLPRLRRRVARPLLACCPERTIQGCAMVELRQLPQVIGGVDERSAERARGFFLSGLITDSVVVSSLEAAEMVKLVNNAHTDVIYGFGNEVALMAAAFGIDAHEVIRSANLRYPRPDLSRPGYVGGSCLVKDPYLLIHAASAAGYVPPLVAAARSVNEYVPRYAADRVIDALTSSGRRLADAHVLVCGIAYKGRPETDDVRGSAAIEMRRILAGRVRRLLGHDFVVSDDRIAALGFEPATIDDGFRDADAVLLLVDHPRYTERHLRELVGRMRRPAVVFDMWGLLDPDPAWAGADVVHIRLGHG